MNITSKQLYRIRRFHGLTMQQMATLLECTDGYINGLEKDKFVMTESIQEKATAVFELTPNRMRSITLHHSQYMEPYEPMRNE